jgi:hypothetical protein
MTRSRDVADTQDNLGGAVAPVVSGKNFVINGGFDIFQRGTFNSQTASNYALDRWYAGVGGTVTITQQTTGAPAGSQYCMRVAYNANSSFANQFQALESANASLLAGQTVTATVLVRANASWAATSSQALGFSVQKNSTANTLIGGTWSTISGASIAGSSIATGTTSSSWTKLTVTCVIPNDGTAAGLRLVLGESVVGPSGAYWEMAQCQLEIGSVATPFSRAGGSIGGELALCQRYYWRQTTTDNYIFFPGIGAAKSTTVAEFTVPNPVPMRTPAASVDSSNVNASDGITLASGGTVSLSTNTQIASRITITYGSGLTAFRPYFIQGATGTCYLGFSAEL